MCRSDMINCNYFVENITQCKTMYGIKQQQKILMRLPLVKQAVVPEADVLFPSSASIHRAYVYISLEFLRPAMWGGAGTSLVIIGLPV